MCSRNLCDVQQARRVFSCAGERVAEHGVAERARSPNCSGSGGDQFLRADVAHALTGLFAQKRETSAGPAAKTALTIARGLDQLPGCSDHRARLVVDVAITAEVAGVVVDHGVTGGQW